MKTRPFSCIVLACAALSIANLAAAQAQRITPVPQATRQAAPPGVATFGMPSPSGLPSPVPGGLTPPTAPSLTPPTSYNLSSPGTPPGSPPIDAGIAQPAIGGGGGGGFAAGPPPVNVMGAAGAGFGRSGFSAVDVARSFIEADGNRDGDLTRSEARRLAIMPMSFEEMDRNFDGVISRFEYEDATR